MAQKFFMELNFTISGKTIKLKSVNWMENWPWAAVKLKSVTFQANDHLVVN